MGNGNLLIMSSLVLFKSSC